MFGFGFDKMLDKIDSFNPLQLVGTKLYYTADDTIPSLATDLSTNAFDLSQGTVLQQPTIVVNGDGGKSVNFDGSNDLLTRTVSSAFGLDTVGSVFFSGYVNTLGTSQTFITSGDTGSSTRFITFGVGSLNRLLFQINNGGTTNALVGNTVLTAGNYFAAEIRQDGTGIRIFLNGVEETVTASSGSNATNLWWDFATLRDNLVMGALVRTTNSFSFSKVNKIYYNNTILNLATTAQINAFMAIPTNY